MLLSILLILSCSGKEPHPFRDRDPLKPILHPHLGAIGDDEFLTDENNGIDSHSQGDRIRLIWDRPLDNSSITIFRFSEDFAPEPLQIHRVVTADTIYLDRFLEDSYVSVTDVEWSYYIRASNFRAFTDSDTVSFTLRPRPILISPPHRAEFTNSDDLKFSWNNDISDSRLRLLLFDNSKNLIWSETIDFVFYPTHEIEYTGEKLSPGFYFWRVDTRGDTFNSGSKSEERRIEIK